MFLASKDAQVPLSASFVQSRRQQRRKRTFLIIQTVTVNLKITFVTLPVGCCLAYFLFCDRDADSSAKFPFVGSLPHNVDSPAAQLQGPLSYDCCVRFSEIRFMKEKKRCPTDWMQIVAARLLLHFNFFQRFAFAIILEKFPRTHFHTCDLPQGMHH